MILKGRRQAAASRVFGFEEGSKQNAMLSQVATTAALTGPVTEQVLGHLSCNCIGQYFRLHCQLWSLKQLGQLLLILDSILNKNYHFYI